MSGTAILKHVSLTKYMRIPLLNSKLNFSTQADIKAVDISKAISTNTVDPLKHPDYFNVHNLFTVKDLYDARVHFGHKEGSLNKYMTPYLFGKRLGHLIFDLDVTAEHLRRALNFTAHIAFRGGIVLFVTRSQYNSFTVDKTALECGEYSNTRHYRGGIFTNSTEQFQAVTRLPDVCIYLNTLMPDMSPHKGVQDCAKMSIPTIGIVDTNTDPRLVTYPVPGNDDSPASIQLYCNLFKTAILRGKAERKKSLENIIE